MGLTEQEMDEITKFVNSGMKKELPNYGFHFFTVILEIAPDAKNMFSFLKDKDGLPKLEDIDSKLNSKLNSHAKSVFKNVLFFAIPIYQFKVVKVALMRTIKEAMGEKWSEEIESTWVETDHQLGAAIKDEMKQEAAKSTTTINAEAEEAGSTAAIKASKKLDQADTSTN